MKFNTRFDYIGLSSEEKPTNKAVKGSTFYELDTSTLYVYNDEWYPVQTPTSGGGGSSGGDGSSMNIFVQEDEPKIKDGIWVQADREIQHIVTDENIYIENQWEQQEEITSKFDSGNFSHNLTNDDRYIYQITSNYMYRYDTIANEMKSIRRNNSGASYGAGIFYNDKIYFFINYGSYDHWAEVYDTKSEDLVSRSLTQPDFGTNGSSIALEGSDIYIYPGSYTSIYKFDTITETYEEVKRSYTSSFGRWLSNSMFWKNNIYIS